MIGEKLGHVFDKPLESFAGHISLHPNTLTIAGFGLTIAASYLLACHLFWGGIMVLVGGAFDLLDGVVARVNKKETRFGAFLDSVLDRYSDALVLLAIAWNLGRRGEVPGVALCLVALVGAFLVSYTRARSEGLGIACRHGLMERPERLVLVSLGAVSGLVVPVLWVLAVSTHFTAVQRIFHVWRAAGGEKGGGC